MCYIDLGESVVITGGLVTPWKLVTQYWENGTKKILPELNIARWAHGCSSYVDKNANIVNHHFLAATFVS